MLAPQNAPLPRSSHRIDLIDALRSAALLGMAAFHFSYDLLMFGLIPGAYAASWTFYLHARLVAGTFILLAGLGLYLAHGAAIRWPAFWKRWLKIAAAALLVTLATRLALPEAWVYFGILHAIALYSLLGLAALRLPAALTALLAAGFVAGAYGLHGPAFDADLLRFIGLSTLPAYTVDFEPIFPWFGAFLSGIALGQIGQSLGLWSSLARLTLPRWLTWPGKHSLIIYLIHQPVLLGLVWAYTQIS
ncbi:MAG: heparan-alpha-glucosaminide N-acetyltransferase [Cypionkella sp.]